MREMQQDAAQEAQMVSLWTEILFCLAVCPEHGYVKGKIRVKKSEDDRLYAVKTAKMADAQDVELLAPEEGGRPEKAQCQGPP